MWRITKIVAHWRGRDAVFRTRDGNKIPILAVVQSQRHFTHPDSNLDVHLLQIRNDNIINAAYDGFFFKQKLKRI
jgi:hypothetical protein